MAYRARCARSPSAPTGVDCSLCLRSREGEDQKMVDDEPEEEEDEDETPGAAPHAHEHHDHHHKHPSVAEIYKERKEERKANEAKLKEVEMKLDVLLKILDTDGNEMRMMYPTGTTVVEDL